MVHAVAAGNHAAGAAGADLDEAQRPVVLGDDVQLAHPATVVALEHPVATALQLGHGGLLTGLAAALAGVAHARASAASRTGANERRCSGQGPSARRAARCTAVP